MGVLIKWCDLPIMTKKVFMWHASNTKKLRLLFLIVFVKLWEFRDDFKFFLSEILFYNEDYHDRYFFLNDIFRTNLFYACPWINHFCEILCIAIIHIVKILFNCSTYLSKSTVSFNDWKDYFHVLIQFN